MRPKVLALAARRRAARFRSASGSEEKRASSRSARSRSSAACKNRSPPSTSAASSRSSRWPSSASRSSIASRKRFRGSVLSAVGTSQSAQALRMLSCPRGQPSWSVLCIRGSRASHVARRSAAGARRRRLLERCAAAIERWSRTARLMASVARGASRNACRAKRPPSDSRVLDEHLAEVVARARRRFATSRASAARIALASGTALAVASRSLHRLAGSRPSLAHRALAGAMRSAFGRWTLTGAARRHGLVPAGPGRGARLRQRDCASCLATMSRAAAARRIASRTPARDAANR